MSLFGGSRSSGRYGVILDVGSGSVLAAIVHSDRHKPEPTVVWSYREHAPLRNVDSLEQSSKAVITALFNVAMRLDSEGRKALHEYDKKAVLRELQCAISAPWSYTVTKTVNYRHDEPFRITEELIQDLTHTVEEQIMDDLNHNNILQDLGLQIITQMASGMTINGYRVLYPEGQKATEIVLSHTSAVSQKYLLDTLEELREKLFQQAEVRSTSFILIFYMVAKEFMLHASDVCLLDVTYEATEIGIVRDGVITYATHIPFGGFSLAREISSVTNIPLYEAFGHLHTETPYAFTSTLTPNQKVEVEKIFESYINKLADLFKETGDTLSIPKWVYLHVEKNSEKLYADLVDKAVRRSIKLKPTITLVTSEILRQAEKVGSKAKQPSDTALLLSARFFHKFGERSGFEYF